LFEEKINAKNLEKLKGIWQELSDKVLREHQLEDGVSVCVYCHGKIDSRYRRYKGEDQEYR
jgi:Cys-tRNA synthase (O-phospho-L-seryl-tRNA:Cys-tRNA synthase)